MTMPPAVETGRYPVAEGETGTAVMVRAETSGTGIRVWELHRHDIPVTSRYEMVPMSLPLLVGRADSDWWALWSRIGEYGVGSCELDAALSLWNSLESYLESLEARESTLSGRLADELRILRRSLRQR